MCMYYFLPLMFVRLYVYEMKLLTFNIRNDIVSSSEQHIKLISHNPVLGMADQ